MNPDERFEERLRELARATGTDDTPTLAWKTEILAAAMAKPAPPRSLAPPRPLLIAWAAAWTAIALLSWPQPEGPGTDLPVVNGSAAPASLLFAYRSDLLQQLDLP